MFNNYPYGDLHEINLDWFLQQFQSLKTLVNNMDAMLTALQSLPDASGASDGQVLTADGNGGWQWEDPQSGGGGDGGIDASVKQAIANLLLDAVYNDPDHAADKAVIQSWMSEITAITLSSSALTFSTQAAQTLTATTTPSGGAVSWSSSDTSIATVSNGVVTPVNNGSCTITATSGNVSATCAVTVSAFLTIVSISAVYTQGGTVYTTDTLDSLKSDLVVTATYDDSSTAVISSSDYTLSGSLTEGTSTITVTYAGLTTTFDVTVSGLLPTGYTQVEYIKSTGTQYIETNLQINGNASSSTNPIKDYTIDIDFAFDEWQSAGATNIIAGVGDTGGCWIGYNNNVGGIALGTSSGMYFADGDTSRHQYNLSYNGTTTATLTRDDNVQISRANTSGSLLNFTLFTTLDYNGNVSSNFLFNGKLYSCVVEHSGVEVLNLVPCYRTLDNEVGLYDIVNNVFYSNDGSGTFEKGADV